MDGTTCPTRMQFMDHQFIDASDLQVEQKYHLHARWRHNLAVHSWGIVAGLCIETNEAKKIIVQRGMAIDGYGRELVLATNQECLEKLDNNQIYDVWLEYTVGPDNATRDHNWLEETPKITVSEFSSRQDPDPSHPNQVAVGDYDFGPERPSPDDDAKWPVFLGRIEFRAEKWDIIPTERRYAGLVAERIVARNPGPKKHIPEAEKPENKPITTIYNGSYGPDPQYQFAIGLNDKADHEDSDNDVPPFFAISTGTKSDAASTRLDLRAERVVIDGDMVLRHGAAVQFDLNRLGNESRQLALSGGHDGWRMYRNFQPPDPAKTKPSTDEKKKEPPRAPGSFSDQLRITMPADRPGGSSVAIGIFADDGKFSPVLEVNDREQVVVYGTLIVKGVLDARVTEATDESAKGTGGTGQGPVTLFEQIKAYVAVSTDQRLAATKAIFETNGGETHLVTFVADKASTKEFSADGVTVLAKSLWALTDEHKTKAFAAGASGISFESFANVLSGLPPEMTGKDGKKSPPARVLGDWYFTIKDTETIKSFAHAVPDKSDNVVLSTFANELFQKNNLGFQALVKALFDAPGGTVTINAIRPPRPATVPAPAAPPPAPGGPQ